MQMPPMPGKNQLSSGESDSKTDSLPSPFTEDSVDKTAESDVKLKIPSHDDRPKLNDPDKDSNSQVAVALTPNKGIEVVAQRKGFYNQVRRKIGDKFFIKSEANFGEWMKCVDPTWEKKRIQIYKDKKAKK